MLRIQGPNSANLNAYQKQVQNQQRRKNDSYKDDLKISKQAQQLQQSKQVEQERLTYVQNIKQLVDSGEYDINHKQVAEKMIQFWSSRL